MAQVDDLPRTGVVPPELNEGLNPEQRRVMLKLVATHDSFVLTGGPGTGKSEVIRRYFNWVSRRGITAGLFLQAIRLGLPQAEAGARWVYGTTVQHLIGSNDYAVRRHRIGTAPNRVPIDTLGKRTELMVVVDECFLLFKKQADAMVAAVNKVFDCAPHLKTVRWIYIGDRAQNDPVGPLEPTIVESAHFQLGVQRGAVVKRMPVMVLVQNMRCNIKWVTELWRMMRAYKPRKNDTKTVDRRLMKMTLDTMHRYPRGVDKIRHPFDTVVITYLKQRRTHWSRLATEQAVRQGRLGVCISPCPVEPPKPNSTVYKPAPDKVLPYATYTKVLAYVFEGATCRATANINDDNGIPVVDNGDDVLILKLPVAARALAGVVTNFNLASELPMESPMQVRVLKTGCRLDLLPTVIECDGIYMYQYPVTWANTIHATQGKTYRPEQHGKHALLDVMGATRESMMVAMSRWAGSYFDSEDVEFLLVNYTMNPWPALKRSTKLPADDRFQKAVATSEAKILNARKKV